MPRAANRPHRQITKPQTGADSAEQIVAFEPIAQIYLPPSYRCDRNGGSDEHGSRQRTEEHVAFGGAFRGKRTASNQP